MPKPKQFNYSDMIREYLDQYADKPAIYNNNAKMARLIYEKHPEMFRNVEDVRYRIRYIRGTAGKSRNKIGKEDQRHFHRFESTVKEFGPRKEVDNSPYVMKAKDVLILADLQYPYYDADALRIAVKYAKENWKSLDAILINGDWFDFYQASDYMRDPRNMRINEELDGGCALIKMLQDVFGLPVVLKFGNHEERFDNYINKKAGELKGVPEFELTNCLHNRIPEGLTIVKDKRIVKLGLLNVIHGHEFRKVVFNPVNPARGLWNRAMTNALQGDCHQPSAHYEKDLNGNIHVTYSTGCLCDLRAAYMPYNKWTHGFCRVQVEKTGEFTVNNKIIVNKKVF